MINTIRQAVNLSKPERRKAILTLIATAVVLGGLIRLAVDDQVVAVSYQEPFDLPADHQ